MDYNHTIISRTGFKGKKIYRIDAVHVIGKSRRWVQEYPDGIIAYESVEIKWVEKAKAHILYVDGLEISSFMCDLNDQFNIDMKVLEDLGMPSLSTEDVEIKGYARRILKKEVMNAYEGL